MVFLCYEKCKLKHTKNVIVYCDIIPLSANRTKWSNKLKQYISNLLTNCLSVFDHFVGLALKGLYLLNTHMLMKDVSWNMYIWHVYSNFHQEINAILLYLIDYLFFSFVLHILSTAFMLKFVLVHLGI